MKKLLLTLSIIFILPISLLAQWNLVSLGTSQDLYSVDYYSANDIWIGSFNQFVKTTTGGASWTVVNPMKDLSSANIAPANVNDIALTSPTNAIATGLFFMGNTEVILTTTNGGTNWDYATSNSTVPLLRYINSLDLNGVRAIGVGNTGRIFRSINSGASWTLTASGTTNMINDVKFSSFDTVFASGTNVMLRSYNGGATWTSSAVTGDFINLASKNNVVYATKSFATTMIKSTDYGVTYSTINLPFSSRGAIHTISRDTILASATDGIYISRDGGTYWEKYSLAGYQVIKMFDFMNSNNGFAVGLAGYVLRTSNLNVAPSLPISMFAIQGGGTSFCQDDSLTFINSTAPLPGYSYQWKLDGTTFSTSYNAGKRMTSFGPHTISLITTNAFGLNTATINVNITGHDINPIVYTASADTVCNGNHVGFTLTGSQVGVTYQLRKGFLNIGTAQSGTGGTLNFSYTSGITTNTNFNIKALKITSCFTDSLIQNKTVYVFSTPSTLVVTTCFPSTNLCSGPGTPLVRGITNVTFNSLNNNSSYLIYNYFDYSCCQQTNLTVGNTYPISITTVYPGGEYVKVWFDLNNDGILNNTSEAVFSGFANSTITGNITVPATFVFNQQIRMRVASSSNSSDLNNHCSTFYYCGEVEDYAVTILPATVLPTTNFTKVVTVGCSTTAALTNTSYNATSFTWNFGDGAPTVTTINTTHSYTTSGTYTITLTSCNPTGCTSTNQVVNVVIPQIPIPSLCNPTMINNYVGTFSTFKFDTLDLSYTLYDGYQDLTCTRQQILYAASTYNIVANLEAWSSCGRLAIWIDYNNDGLFTQSERINRIPGINSVCAGGYFPFPVQIPETAVLNTPLRLRALVYEPGYCGMPAYLDDGCNSGGCITGGDMVDYTVFIQPALPVTVGFTAATTTSCTSNYVSFTNTSTNATHYLWDFGDGTTDTTAGPSAHMYALAGTYTVKLRVSNNLYADSLIRLNYITINTSLPVPVITLAGNVLSTVAVAPSYQWYRNGTLIGGATSSSYVLTLDGNYTLNVINSNGCVTTSASYAYFPPHVNFTASPTTGCGATYVFLDNTSTNCTNYTVDWGDGSAPVNYSPPGGLAHNYIIFGTFTMKVIGCGAQGCDSLIRINYITIYPIPATPIITYISGQLTTPPGATTYQWYLNGGIIGGATFNTYTPLVDGNYTVRLTGAGGCSAISAIYPHFPVVVNFSADTVGYCGVSSASVSFINTTLNASTYLWNFGDGATSTLASPIHIYSASGSYTVKLVACGSNCDSITNANYIVIAVTPFIINITPVLTTTICSGGAVTFSGNFLSGVTYQWQNYGSNILGATDTSYVATNDGDYNLIATNASGCIATSNTAILIVDWNCVWPGDADQSYLVDNYDLLPIGLFYGQTGIPRATIDNSWTAFSASDWGILYGGWMDIKQADCNGDGTIDGNDTLAINLNFTSVHSIVPPPISNARSTNPDIYCVSSSATYTAGDWIDIDIMAGTLAEPVVNLYGIAFDLYYDNSLVEPGTASMIFSDSWLTDIGTNGLSIGKVDAVGSLVNAGVTRVSHTGKNGYGKLGTLRFQAATSIISQNFMYFQFWAYNALDQTGTPLPFDFNAYLEITIDPISTSLDVLSIDNSVDVYPNPFTDNTTITFFVRKEAVVNIEVFNSIGQKIETIVNENKKSGKYSCVFSPSRIGFDAGIYFVKITIDGKTTMRRIVEMK